MIDPLRTLLFIPGHREAWIEPACASGTDAILFDLQDAVPPDRLDDARSVVAAAVARLAGTQPAVLARVNAVGSPEIEHDLRAVVRPGLTGVMVPAVEGPDDVAWVAAELDRLENERGIPIGTTRIMPLVETARAARFSFEVATASGRVAYMGGVTGPGGDLERSLGFRWTPEGTETLVLRSWVLLNVRAAGIPCPVSGVWTTIGDLDGLRAFAEQTRALGYEGMMAVHPSHVAVINEVFTPTPEDIRTWQKTLGALDGGGTARVDDVMVDAAHVRTAKAGLALARRLGLVDG